MKKFLIVLSLLVGLGFLVFLFHKGATTKAPQGMAGAQVQNDTFNFTGGFNAGSANQFSVSSTGALTTSAGITNLGNTSAATWSTASVGSSSSSPAALGSAASGHFVVAAGATTVGASTTAVTLNSDIQLTLEQTTPIAGTTCNSAVNASSTYAITSKVAGNGFNVTIASAPVTNPFCYSYSITN